MVGELNQTEIMANKYLFPFDKSKELPLTNKYNRDSFYNAIGPGNQAAI